MSTLTPPVPPASSSTPTSRSRDRARGDASGSGAQDFAAVLDGHLAASKKPGGSKPAGRSAHHRDERDARVDAGSPLSACGSPTRVAGQVASRAVAGGQPAGTGAAGPDDAAVDAIGAAADAPAAGAGSGGAPAQSLLGTDGDATGADTSASDAVGSAASATAAGQVPGSDGTLSDRTSAGDAGTRSGQPDDQSPTITAAGQPPAERPGQRSGMASHDAVETISLAAHSGAAGSAQAQSGAAGSTVAPSGAGARAATAGTSGADDQRAPADRVADLATTPVGVTAGPPTTKPDGAQGAAPTTAAPATPVVAQVAPAVGRVVSRGDGEHRMMLRLHPADLGEIHLTVTVRGDHVDVDIAAGSQARDLLRDGSVHLRSLLESIGRNPGQLVLRDLPAAPATSPAATAGGTGSDTGSGAASYAGDGTAQGDTGREQPAPRGGARPEPPTPLRESVSTRTTRTYGVLGGTALDVTV